MSELLTKEEVASNLGFSVETVERFIWEGHLQSVLVGGVRCIPAEAYHALVAAMSPEESAL